MRSILAIECTHHIISIAVGGDAGIVERQTDKWQKAAEAIVPLIEEVLVLAGTERERLEALVISSGPGSFTALRIGMATAKGLAFGLGLPLLPVSTIGALGLAAMERFPDRTVVPLIPARKGEYYFSVMPPRNREPSLLQQEVSYASVEQIGSILSRTDLDPVVVGRELDGVLEVCRVSGGDTHDADFFTAASLLQYGEEILRSGQWPALAEVVPEYHQNFTPHGGKKP